MSSPAWLILPVVGAGVGGQARAEGAEQYRNRCAQASCLEVPQGDVDRAMAHMIVSADIAPQILPDLLAGVGIAADEMRCEHRGLGERCRRADPVRDVLTARVVVGLHADRPPLIGQGAPFLGDDIANARGAVGWQANPLDLEGEASQFNARNPSWHTNLPYGLSVLGLSPALDGFLQALRERRVGLPIDAGRDPAVDDERVAGHETRLVAGQP